MFLISLLYLDYVEQHYICKMIFWFIIFNAEQSLEHNTMHFALKIKNNFVNGVDLFQFQGVYVFHNL